MVSLLKSVLTPRGFREEEATLTESTLTESLSNSVTEYEDEPGSVLLQNSYRQHESFLGSLSQLGSLRRFSLVSTIKRLMLIGYAIIASAGMIVAVRLWGEMTPGYSFFYSASWAVGLVPCFALALLVTRYAPTGTFLHRPPAGLDNLRTGLLQCTPLSLCYAVNYLGVSTSTPHLSGPMQVLLQQFPTVFTMVFATIYLQRAYSLWCWAGTSLILLGTATQQLVPLIVSGHTTSEAPPFWMALYVLGMLPLGVLPSLFEGFSKPRGLDHRRMSPEYRLLMLNALLMVWLLLLAPLFVSLGQPPEGQFLEQSAHAADCVVFGNAHPEDVPAAVLKDPATAEKLSCRRAGPLLLGTILVAGTQMHSQLLLSTTESGPLAAMLIGMSPFVADIVFPWPALMGIYTEMPSEWCLVGSVMAFVGLLVFMVFERRDRHSHRSLTSVPSVNFFLRESWDGNSYNNLYNYNDSYGSGEDRGWVSTLPRMKSRLGLRADGLDDELYDPETPTSHFLRDASFSHERSDERKELPCPTLCP